MWLWRVYSCFQWYKNYENPPRVARVIIENKVVPFFSGHGVYFGNCEIELRWQLTTNRKSNNRLISWRATFRYCQMCWLVNVSELFLLQRHMLWLCITYAVSISNILHRTTVVNVFKCLLTVTPLTEFLHLGAESADRSQVVGHARLCLIENRDWIWKESSGIRFSSQAAWNWLSSELRVISLIWKCSTNGSGLLFDVRYDIRKHFSHRIVNWWNSLSALVVYASSIIDCKHKLDAHWFNREMAYNYRVEISETGSFYWKQEYFTTSCISLTGSEYVFVM